MKVEVVYALPESQMLVPLDVVEGTTAEQAIRLSGILTDYPEIDLNDCKIGIFSKLCELNTELRELDRVEIYRPLLVDPKEVRRKKAEQKRAQKKV